MTPAMAIRRFCPPESSSGESSNRDSSTPDVLVHLGLRESHVPGTEGDVPVHGLLEQLILRVLEHQPHPIADGVERLLGAMDILAVKEDLSLPGGKQSVEMLDQGALAAASVTDKGHVLAGGDLQVYVVESDFFKGCALAVHIPQGFQTDVRHGS